MAQRGYYSISDILMTQELVPVEFNIEAESLGHLDPSATSEHLVEGTKLELPLWLADPISRKNFVTPETPKHFTARYRSALKADAQVVNLADWSPYYYHFGTHVASILKSFDMAEAILNTLIESFTQRSRTIIDLSQNSLTEDVNELTRKLDSLEKHLFLSGHAAVREFDQWKQRNVEQIPTSKLVQLLKKRKRT